MILGLVGCFVVPLIASVAAIVTAVMAKNKIKEDPQRYGGEGMATAGLWLGIVGTVLGLIGLIFWIVVFGLVFSFAQFCEENPDDPDCQDEGFLIDDHSVIGPQADLAPEPAWSWAALPLVAGRRRAPAAF